MGDDLVINLKKAFVFMSTMLALISVSCTSSMIIKLNSDESASFSSNSKPIDYERYLNSNIIYNIDSTSSMFSFDIQNIDSLGYYLPLLEPGFFLFKTNRNVLIIKDNQTEHVFSNKDKSCFGINFIINSKNELIIKTPSEFVKEKKNHISIIKSKKQLLARRKKIDVEIQSDLR